MIENYLAEESDNFLISPISEKDWVQVVNRFVTRCSHLDKVTGPFSHGYRSRVSSRASSRAGSLSEGHVSPEDDGPSKKIVHFDD